MIVRRDRRVRLLHRRHHLAAAAACAVLHRAGHSASPPGWGDRPPERRLGYPAGPQPAGGLGERGRRRCFVLRDHDSKFSRSFDDVFCAEGAEMLVMPGADAERERPCGALDPDGARRVPGLAADRRARPPRAGPSGLFPVLQRPPCAPGALATAARSSRGANAHRQGSAGPNLSTRPARWSRARVPGKLHERIYAPYEASQTGRPRNAQATCFGQVLDMASPPSIPADTFAVGPAGKTPRRSLGRCLGQAVAGGLRFWRGPRFGGVLFAAVVDPGLRPRFFSVLPTPANCKSR